jgi:hypothetical protein
MAERRMTASLAVTYKVMIQKPPTPNTLNINPTETPVDNPNQFPGPDERAELICNERTYPDSERHPGVKQNKHLQELTDAELHRSVRQWRDQ